MATLFCCSSFGQSLIRCPRPPHSARTGGILCLASCSKCFRSSSVVSLWFLFINVVAIPVFPHRPVLPILCT
ncbi:hypothetical protein BRARA_K00497 [Brassica rapa]|uniref:Uncharacterized protein n=1 Tax=Brassica campestris TaxID=3711 RepID=A0A397KY98_BRACM|nr:hypothetical protein BRARA_K00497 [Brassica rapa]